MNAARHLPVASSLAGMLRELQVLCTSNGQQWSRIHPGKKLMGRDGKRRSERHRKACRASAGVQLYCSRWHSKQLEHN